MCLKSEKELWYLDNGRSRYMSGNVALFIEIRKKEHRNIDIGKVGKDPFNSIDNVCLVDELKFILLSISQLCDKGNPVCFDSTHCVV